MCAPLAVPVAMFAMQAGGAVAKQQGKEKAVKYRNRARLRNYKIEEGKYQDQVMIRNNQYKNQVSQHEIEKDEIFKSAYDSWQKDEQQLDAILLEHGFNTQEAIINMHKGGYAGTMTGVTAGRLAQASSQEAGRAITKSLAKVMLNEENIITNREVIRRTADQKMRSSWEKVRFSPIHGAPPTPPALEAKPSSAGMWLEIGIAAAGAYMGGASAMHADSMSKKLGQVLSNQEAQKNLGGNIFGTASENIFINDSSRNWMSFGDASNLSFP